jgi:hypothetical protein
VSGERKKYAFGLIAIVLTAGIAWYFWGTGSVPLVSLNPNNFDQFGNVFNEDARATRAVLLLSPT